MSIMTNSDAISATMESIGPLVFQTGANQLKGMMNEAAILSNEMAISTNSAAISIGGGGAAPDLSSLEMVIGANSDKIASNMMSISANSDGISTSMQSFDLLTM